MAGDKRKEIAQAYVRLYPVIDGLARAIASEIGKATSGADTSGKKIGEKLSRGINRGLQNINESGITGILQGGLSKTFSGVANLAGSAFRRVGSIASSTLGRAFRSSGAVLQKTMVSASKAGATAIGGIIATGIGVSVTKGMSRALSMNEARAKMKGLGYEGAELDAIIKSASDAMDGLAYSTGDAATAASGLLASGVKPGKELTSILRTIGDTASLTGREFGDISSIYGKVFASGIIQGEELNQLMDSGVPILQYLSKELGVSELAVKKLASQGKVSSQQFARAMENNLGGVGERMAQASFKLSAKNVVAQVGRVLEPVFTTAIESAIPLLNQIRARLKDFVNFIHPVLEPIQKQIESFFSNASKYVEKFNIEKAFDKATKVVEQFKGALLPIAGLLAGLGSSLLSSLPVVGGLFGGLTAPVGLLAGLFGAVYASSDKLKESLGNLAGSIGDLLGNIFKFDIGNADFGDIFGGIGDKIASGIDKLNDYISDKTGFLTELFDSFSSKLLNGSTLRNLGDTLGNVFESITNILGGAISVIIEVATDPRIRNAFAQIADALSNGLNVFSGAVSADKAGNIASSIASVVSIIGGVAVVIIETLTTVIGAIGKFVATPAFEGFTLFLKNLANTLLANTDLIKYALLTVGGLFAGFKVFNVIRSLKLPKMPNTKGFTKSFANFAKGFGKGIESFLKTLPGIGKAITSAFPAILKIIAVSTGVAIALAGVGALFDSLKIGAGLEKLGNALNPIVDWILGIVERLANTLVNIFTVAGPKIATALASIFSTLRPLFEGFNVFLNGFIQNINLLISGLLPIFETAFNGISSVLSSFGDYLSGSAEVISSILGGLSEILNSIFTGISDVMVSFGESVSVVIGALADGGFEAAGAATALAGGILALNAAMAGGTLMQGGADFADSLLGLGEGIVDTINPANWGKSNVVQQEGSAMTQILELINGLQSANNLVTALNTNWNQVAGQAFTAGTNIILMLVKGLSTQGQQLSSALTTQLSTMLNNAQAQLNARPLQVRVAMPTNIGVGYSDIYSRGSFNNRGSVTQNFTVNNPNPFATAEILRNKMRAGVR